MANKEFDERYPAMFQPGGEDLPADHAWLQPNEHAANITAGTGAGRETTWRPAKLPPQSAMFVAPPLQLPSRAPAFSHAPEPGTAVPDAALPTSAETEDAAPATASEDRGDNADQGNDAPAGEAPGPGLMTRDTARKGVRLPWRVATVVGALLLAAGAVVPGAPQWIANNSTNASVIQMAPMWTYIAAQVAAPMLGMGVGVLALLLLLAIQMHPARRAVLRSLFFLASMVVLAFGLFAQFSTYIFPPVQYESVDSVSGANTYYFSQPDLVVSLGTLAFGPLLAGILMVAALALSQNYSLLRSYVMGLLLLCAAAFAQCAPYLFPDVRPTTQLYDGGNQSIPGWPYWLPALTPALVAAAVLVIAAAAAWPSLRAACLAMVPATMAATPSNEEFPTENVNQEEDAEHVHAKL